MKGSSKETAYIPASSIQYLASSIQYQESIVLNLDVFILYIIYEYFECKTKRYTFTGILGSIGKCELMTMSKKTPTYSEAEKLLLLKEGNHKAFDAIYDAYADELLDFIVKRVKLKEVAEEIIQDIFLSVWKNKQQLSIHTSLRSYLLGAARNRIFSYIKSEMSYRKYATHFALFVAENHSNLSENLIDLADLEYKIESLIQQLPDKCQQAFRLSRIQHLSLKEVAEKMNISKRTVENYITQALSHLRKGLVNYVPLALLWYRFWQ